MVKLNEEICKKQRNTNINCDKLILTFRKILCIKIQVIQNFCSYGNQKMLEMLYKSGQSLKFVLFCAAN
jgi:hypothetical protein